MELKFTQYWPWYRQRLWRILNNQSLIHHSYVKHVDRVAQFHNDLRFYSHLREPRSCMIDEQLTTHLPYLVDGVWPKGAAPYSIMCPDACSIHEHWCTTQFGPRDREWLYLGNSVWAFRLAEQACEFALTWN